jgi:hypothetical protein
VKSSDVPHLKEANVPESKKTTEPAPAPAKVSLAPAGESGDPAVHQVLAELQSARSNDDADAVKAWTEKLADLGYE